MAERRYSTNDSPKKIARNLKAHNSKSDSVHLPEIKSLAKKFMHDPSVFKVHESYEVNVGPGSYELPPVMGKARKEQSKTLNSSHVSGSKLLEEDSKSGPGVCKYDPNKEAILPNSPQFASPKEDRFRWLGNSKEANIPLIYEPDISTKLKRHGVRNLYYIILIGQISQM